MHNQGGNGEKLCNQRDEANQMLSFLVCPVQPPFAGLDLKKELAAELLAVSVVVVLLRIFLCVWEGVFLLDVWLKSSQQSSKHTELRTRLHTGRRHRLHNWLAAHIDTKRLADQPSLPFFFFLCFLFFSDCGHGKLNPVRDVRDTTYARKNKRDKTLQ